MWTKRALVLALAAGIGWLNLYIVRDLFVVESTAQMHSMHGFWTALARLGAEGWMTPSWWPYWDGGMPREYAYAPLIPAAASAIAALFGVSELRAIQMVFGIVLVAGPTLLFVGLCALTGTVRWSFIAAAAYTLLSAESFLSPMQGAGLQNLLSFERLYVVVVWDEAPHMTALALWPFAVLSLFRIVETKRWTWVAGGVLLMATMVYASAFGATLLAVTAICVWGSLGFGWGRIALLALAGALTYLCACAAMPLSLVKVIREAAAFHGQGWSWGSGTTLALVGVAWALVQPWLMRRVSDSRLRFFVLFAMTALLIAWLYKFGGRQFVPQPERYRMELAVGATLAAVFALRLHWRKLNRPMAGALLALALALAAEQTVSGRKWAKQHIQDRDVAATMEYRMARAVDALVPPEERVMLTGSLAQWNTAFSDRQQFSGSSWSTAPNLAQQRVRIEISNEVGDIRRSMMWFHAFGVGAVAVAGPKSPTSWIAFTDPTKYDGHLETLWSEEDTTIYRVPLRSASLAHAIADGSQATSDWSTVQPFVRALQAERLPGLTARWDGHNRLLIDGRVLTGEIVSTHVNYHSGWTARVDGAPVPLESDGLGQMLIRPDCNGECSIELTYTGGFELNATRWISAFSVLTMVGILWWGRRGQVVGGA